MNRMIAKRMFALTVMVIAAVAGARPNMVVIMADDIGLGDLSYYHRQRTDQKPAVETPNLDRLIKEGVRFADAHSPASLCAPTRFSMLTGNFTYRNAKPFGVWHPDADPLIDPGHTTSARIAKAGGYHTSFFGKWGLGGSWKSGSKVDWARESGGALSYGFDYAVELPEGIQNIPFAFYENREWMKLKPDSVMKELDAFQTGYHDAKKHKDRGGVGDSNWDPTQAGPILAGKAVAYIKRQTTSHPGEPFFLYYCSQAVHIPHTPAKSLNGIAIAGSTAARHGDMIRELDTQVGMIVEALKQAGVYENTLLIFTSDNGGLGWDEAMLAAGHRTSNGLRGAKGSIYEGGHRVPLIAVWPGKVTPDTECHQPVVGHDVVATIAALTGQALDRKVVKDSISLLPYITGEGDGESHKVLMHQAMTNGGFFALRQGPWKLIMRCKSQYTKNNIKPAGLYNLDDNLFETTTGNLIDDPAQAGRVKAMMAKYIELRASDAPTIVD